MSRILLVDAYSLIYRSYYAFINSPRMNSKGLNTSAIFGFINGLLEAIKVNNPSHIAVLFDTSGPTFRHTLFPAYKANREQTPEDIRTSVPIIKDILDALNIARVEKSGFEADDLAGTLSALAEQENFEIRLFTTDKDYFQLVSENCWVYRPQKGGIADFFTIAKVIENFEIKYTSQVIDILALWGDATDNVPGAKGVGEKTAKKLIADFESVENLIDKADTLSGKLKETIKNEREQIILSKKLVTIARDVPDMPAVNSLGVKEPNLDRLKQLFDDLEFKTLWQRFAGRSQPEVKKLQPMQLSLFDTPTTLVEPVQEIPQTEYETIDTITHVYKSIVGESDLKILVDYILQHDKVCFDTETTGLDLQVAELVGLSFSVKAHEAFYVPVPANWNDTLAILRMFEPFFSNNNILKIGQNIKFDLLMLRRYGIEVKGALFDTMVAHYLLQPELKHNMDYMAETCLNYKPVSIETLIGKKGAGQLNMRSVDLAIISDYASEDADITFQLYEYLYTKMENTELMNLAVDMEMPLVHVLADMESEGVRLNPEPLVEFSKQLGLDSAQLELEIIELCGVGQFNIASPKQLGDVLFDKLKIDPSAKRTKTQQYITNEETLEKLSDKHPVVNKILEYRGLKKLQSTYVDALPRLINSNTGKIHTSFNQTITSTGRLSSVNPNLQNIPIRDEKGKELRKAFVASAPDHVLMAADYSQIELRIMAHVSEDSFMIEAFNRGDDIHASTAAKIYGISLEDVTKDMRRKAKTANFGIIYGISAFGLSQRLSIPRSEAKELIDGYFRTFPGVKEYMESAKQKAKEHGYVETIYGRKRYLADINSANAIVRGFAERNAINAPIQGSAADIIKLAMVHIDKSMKEQALKSKMILQVHDELLFDVVPEELNKLKELVRDKMQNVITLKVPLIVDVGVGSNWLEAH